MGFETQEEAERWAENMEFRADQAKEDALLMTPFDRAWKEVTKLPAYKELSSPGMRDLLHSMFKAGWSAAFIEAARIVNEEKHDC